MSDDWKPGDLALCVKGGSIDPHFAEWRREFPVSGRVYEVADVELEYFLGGVGYDVALVLRDGPVNVRSNGVETQKWWHGRFRKLDPHREDEDDREIIAILTYAPVPTPEPVV